jgi:hypothetical protein
MLVEGVKILYVLRPHSMRHAGKLLDRPCAKTILQVLQAQILECIAGAKQLC